MRPIVLLLACCIACPAADLPLQGISHVTFRVSDLDKARAFYTGLLGFPEAFDFKNDQGVVTLAFLKVNDDQYIELAPILKPGQDQRMTHISLETPSVEKLHAALEERGLNPTPLQPPGRDGTRALHIQNPEGNALEFTEYTPGSMHANARGKFTDAPRISTHLLHAGIVVERADLDQALAFYEGKLGFHEFWRGSPEGKPLAYINVRIPGARGDYLELMVNDGNLSRQRLGSMQHAALEVPDIHAALRTIQSRDKAHTQHGEPKIGRNRKWQLNLFDPDGSRVELMEPKEVPAQSAAR